MLGEKTKGRDFKPLKFYDDYFEGGNTFKLFDAKKEHKMSEKSYIKGFFVKCLENMSSAKMWLFLLPFIASTGIMGYFMYQSLAFVQQSLNAAGVDAVEMSAIIGQLGTVGDIFIAWCTFNVSLTTVIIAVREVFKVKKLQALTIPAMPATAAKEINKINS